jgi:NitT/TauT family transport system substrate-binding protein
MAGIIRIHTISHDSRSWVDYLFCRMTLKRTVLVVASGWVLLITALHTALNVNWSTGKYRLGFLPVTCHLTCPVTDYINKQMEGDGFFEPVRFNGWPELKEAFLGRHTRATFILAPMAIALREEGIPIKVVYLGHRDGTAMMVHKNSNIHRIEDLRGKKVAVPSRFSNQYLLLLKAFKERGMSLRDIQLVEMAPPDMPTALYARAVDAVSSGEPFMAQTELDGYGRVLYLTKDIWPGFISCVLAVHEEMIENNRTMVQELVDGIARSGKWLDDSMDHRMEASRFVSRFYYNQDPRLLEFVLSKPPDRVKYSNLALLRNEFEEIQALGVEGGILRGSVSFDDYSDASFVRDDELIQPHSWKGTP